MNSKPKMFSFTVLQFIIAFLVLAGILFSNWAGAQVWIRGYLKDSFTHRPIANGKIKNKLTTAITDENGFFRLKVQEGDVLLVRAPFYQLSTVHFSFPSIDSFLFIYLKPLGAIMKNVTVQTNYSRYQMDSMRRRAVFEKEHSRISAISREPHPGFGLVINLDHFSKRKDRQRKQQQKLFEETEQWAYVRSRFFPALVKAYTGLTGDSLNTFINQYTPSYQWLRAHPKDEQVIFYINDKMKDFEKTKAKSF